MDAGELDWNRTLREQWAVHWRHQLRARLEGLTDDEYFWSPVQDAWSVRLRDLYLHTNPATNGAAR
ncbi:hypothetical protein OG585_54530 (plasmid) [Streptomyces sp. NBC_01340]|uniref:hypothetical protein n=1 Tax=unclassified Streptomyces TaxID=2593676 RepID=UPI0022524EED|nr:MULTISPECIES: hypothetical protein [unclassified Streptomyces]MCX4460088.1 hypothetical protein [Streptomyces sp. NBC_01719]MCX4500581.1 hypothetical protein [Streptomyces sp. NBC_01728]MCX4598494.1 hypothetical protein [Streptomyces sp. NBC_01549]WSI45996.1 hypothetical protein OG585_54530 [Streptomyces sp. NBC_01340]